MFLDTFEKLWDATRSADGSIETDGGFTVLSDGSVSGGGWEIGQCRRHE